MTKIRVVQHASKPLKWWYEQFKADRLDLTPVFQRKSELWSKFKRAHLIDSIINDFDIPKLYVADFTLGRSKLNAARKPYAVVDGKQRFEAVFAFFDDEFTLNSSTLLEEDPDLEIFDLTFSQLSSSFPGIARKIELYEPVVMSIATDDDQKIYEMFVRLNSGEAANSAEKRNARPGPIPQMVREIVAHPFFLNRVRFNKKRMAEFNLAAKLLMIEHRNGFVDTKARNLDSFVDDAAEEVGTGSPPSTPEGKRALKRYEASRDRVIKNLERMCRVFRQSDPLLSAAGHIPVYYWVLKNHPEVAQNFADFLNRFSERVLTSMRNQKSGEGRAEPRLVAFYTHGRTTNDQQSLVGRYEIIESELRRARLI